MLQPCKYLTQLTQENREEGENSSAQCTPSRIKQLKMIQQKKGYLFLNSLL